jgi:hypothetical protein
VLHVVCGLAGVERVGATGVVPHHAPERAPGVRGRVWTERQTVWRQGRSKVVEHDAGLHPGAARRDVDLEDLVHVTAHVEHDRDVARLPGQAGARAAAHDRCVESSTDLKRLHYVVVIHWKDHTKGNLTVVRRVRRVGRSSATVKGDLATHFCDECTLEFETCRFVNPRIVD